MTSNIHTNWRRIWRTCLAAAICAAVALALAGSALAGGMITAGGGGGGYGSSTSSQQAPVAADYQGWATVAQCGTCQWYASAWRWSHGSWSYTWLSRGSTVYAYPYGSGFTWVWTRDTGWLAVQSRDVLTTMANDVTHYSVNLQPVPHDPTADGGSNVTGTGDLWLDGTKLTARFRVHGLDALPHVMHIHGKEAAAELATCPGAARRNKLVDDGLIETAEGIDDYGPVQVSFTTSGDTSAGSALSLDRYASADLRGELAYQRAFSIPLGIAQRITQMHVVIHGDDINHDGVYGGRITALGAPLEAELPVACGTIDLAY